MTGPRVESPHGACAGVPALRRSSAAKWPDSNDHHSSAEACSCARTRISAFRSSVWSTPDMIPLQAQPSGISSATLPILAASSREILRRCAVGSRRPAPRPATRPPSRNSIRSTSFLTTPPFENARWAGANSLQPGGHKSQHSSRVYDIAVSALARTVGASRPLLSNSLT
jgi:hypothetical protein